MMFRVFLPRLTKTGFDDLFLVTDATGKYCWMPLSVALIMEKCGNWNVFYNRGDG